MSTQTSIVFCGSAGGKCIKTLKAYLEKWGPSKHSLIFILCSGKKNEKAIISLKIFLSFLREDVHDLELDSSVRIQRGRVCLLSIHGFGI